MGHTASNNARTLHHSNKEKCNDKNGVEKKEERALFKNRISAKRANEEKIGIRSWRRGKECTYSDSWYPYGNLPTNNLHGIIDERGFGKGGGGRRGSSIGTGNGDDRCCTFVSAIFTTMRSCGCPINDRPLNCVVHVVADKRSVTCTKPHPRDLPLGNLNSATSRMLVGQTASKTARKADSCRE